jgi:hypothetical protein
MKIRLVGLGRMGGNMRGDPEGSGLLGVRETCDAPGWCEIADVCESTWSMVDGVTVQA